jgi:site-specific recombinase XerD
MEVSMTLLRQRMLEELQRHNYSQATIESYILSVKDFAEYFHKSPDLLGAEEVRRYQLYLINNKKLAAQTVKVRMSALRFFYWKTLKRRDLYFDDLPLPKIPKRLPTVLSPEEIIRLIQAASSVMHRTILILLYATGMRRAELRWLQVSDIDSQRMVIHIQQGKGRRDRDIPMTPLVLKVLKEYWRHAKPKVCLFPSPFAVNAPEKPISSKTVRNVVHEAAVAAGLTKRIGPHTLRHSFATHHMEDGTDLLVLQPLLGHAELKNTLVYVHLSQHQMRAAVNPLDRLNLQAPPEDSKP